MGGLLHRFDFNKGGMARKILKDKKQVGGLEAPRNSLELQVEASQSYSVVGDLLVEEDWSEKSSYPPEASMSNLINKEISKRSSTRQNRPSIVARLMGIETMALETDSMVKPMEIKNENMSMKSSRKNERGLIGHVPSHSNSSQQMELDFFDHNQGRDAERFANNQKSGKPKRREHPQEEELQKFKKEFEAWQAARFKECSAATELGSISSKLLAQENLNSEKMELFAKSRQKTVGEPAEPKDHALKSRSLGRDSLRNHSNFLEFFPYEQKGTLSSRSRTLSRDFEESFLLSSNQKFDTCSAPTRIVILKPGPDRLYNNEESWTSPSRTSDHRDSLEDFLEEVKQRLKREMQGKTVKRGSVVRGSGIETPYSEKSSNPKQIAQNIAKQARETVSRDLGMNLRKSESTRSYKSEIQFNGPRSPVFLSSNTRKFPSEKRETDLNIPRKVADGKSESFVSDNKRVRFNGANLLAQNEVRYCEIVQEEQEMQTRSFRQGLGDDRILHKELSPRNLVRSLSAPVSGTSFGKLLLEDRHVFTGAHVQRKHEVVENVSLDMKKQKKDRFNFKEKVSNFGYSFSLTGRLFGKKIQSMIESHNTKQYPTRDFMSGPTVVTNFGERPENFTEVPPSPASVSSIGQEEFWRSVDGPSPLSTADVTPRNEYLVPHAFKEISTNLNELRRKLNQLECDEPEDIAMEEEPEPEPVESELLELEDPAEAYVRDLLVASGLYDGSSEKHLSRWETLAKPISTSVFEEVEESYKKACNESKDDDENKVDRKLLLDLLNEALLTVLGPSMTISKFRRKLFNSSITPSLHGRKLLDSVWEIIREHLYPPSDIPYYSLDNMIARDLRLAPWFGMMDDEVSILGREVESLIIADVVEKMLENMSLL